LSVGRSEASEKTAYRLWSSVALLAFLLASCVQPAAERPNAAVMRVLFIGNSLTATNGLPAMVQAVAAASGDRFECVEIAYPSLSLEDHWSRGEALRAIKRRGWSFVVLQQGPSALSDSRVLLREYVRRFDAEVRRSGARTALYMVWPASTRRGDFDAVSESYALAAKDVAGVLLGAGDLWRAAWRRQPELPLYGPDGFHPSPLGSYVAALAIYRGLTGRPPHVGESLQSSSRAFPAIKITSSTVKMLESISAR
jgi:hypothetical protein